MYPGKASRKQLPADHANQPDHNHLAILKVHPRGESQPLPMPARKTSNPVSNPPRTNLTTSLMSINTLRILTLVPLPHLEAQTVSCKIQQVVKLLRLKRRGEVIPITAFTPATQVIPLTQIALAQNIDARRANVNVQ